MKKSFYSNGKLLLTGEYLVLDGAKALALPTKFGQNLIIENGINKEISWKSFDFDNSIWVDEILTFSEIINNKSNGNSSVKNTLIEILHQAYWQNPSFINKSEGYHITTQLTFPKFWGLGTSSTLINNIAQWLQIDAYALLKNSFGGSGYDIACAQNNMPILYQLVNQMPTIKTIDYKPKYNNHLYFVYLNQKQSSKDAIVSYNNAKFEKKDTIKNINNITESIIENASFDSFKEFMELHENVMSSVLKIQTVQKVLFPDFTGFVKSLGAWGGDFVLAVSEENPTAYFKSKGYDTIIPYAEMIL